MRDFPTDKHLFGFYADTSVARRIDKESAVVQVVFVVPTSTLWLNADWGLIT